MMRRTLPPRLFQIALVLITLTLILPGTPPLLAASGWIWVLRGLGVAVTVGGLSLLGQAHSRFIRNGSEIKTFDTPRNLLTEGPYAWSRNPMYLGFALLLLGPAMIVASPWAALPVLGFVAVCNWHYIPFEEARAAETFGAPYVDYRKQARRWF
jgi:protein-S-isoprenylcysteine O-methyltransferase Ste14